jgi:DNA-binding CsgD family transcriptional regulator/tetratricopeptide (TPR) repeat protein
VAPRGVDGGAARLTVVALVGDHGVRDTGIRDWPPREVANVEVSSAQPVPRAFVGRAVELGVFSRAIGDARLGVPSVLLVGAEAGMGKTTLLTEAAARATAQLSVGRCLQLGGTVVPLGPLVDLLRHLQRTSPDALAATEGLTMFAPWLSSPRLDDQTRGRASAEGVFAPVVDLFGRLAADDVLVVAFEDLHWADPATWDLFDLLARNLFDEHVVLVGTYRADEVARDPVMRRRVAELARLTNASRIEMSGLERSDVAARVAALTGGAADAGLVDRVFERGEGNPFFTEELVRAHRDGVDVPELLSDLISHDLASLPLSARNVVGVAAAIGREAAHDLLAAVVDLDDEVLEDALRSALEARVLVVDRHVDGYRFRHALIAEVVYDELLPSRRRRLHRRIADALLDGQADPMSADGAGQLAFHLDRSGDIAGAFTALLRAADVAETVAPAVALRQLERAFELWDDAGAAAAREDRCDRLWQAAELATGSTGNDRAVVLAREAFTCGIPSRGAAWAHERLGRYLWASGELAASGEEFRAAADLLATGADEPGAALTMAGLAQADLMGADITQAERWCRQVFERVPVPAVDLPAWVMATRVLGAARADVGAVADGAALCRAAVAAANSAYTRALATAYLGIVLVEAGEYQEAVSVALDGGGDARRAGLDRSFGAYFDSEAAEGLMRLGRWDDADAVLADRYAAGMEAFHPGRARVVVTAAVLAARRGDQATALERLDQTRSRPVDPFHEPLIEAGAAEAHLALGDWARALDAAERGWTAAVARRRRWWMVRFAMFSTWAAVERALDDMARRVPVDVVELAGRLTERLDRARIDVTSEDGEVAPIVAAQLAHGVAMVTSLTGADPDAWAVAADRWGLLGDRWMAAEARLREAEASVSVGDAAGAALALRAAHTTALELTSAMLLGRVESVSRRTRISVESTEIVTVDERSADRLGLTPREAEVLAHVAAGRTNRQIGEELYVSEKTASVHVSNILRKLGVSTRVEAAAVAQRLGID